MSSTSDLIHHAESNAVVQSIAQPNSIGLKGRILPALAAVLLGSVLLYGAGFASTIELHNAAHDGRHSAGFPCH